MSTKQYFQYFVYKSTHKSCTCKMKGEDHVVSASINEWSVLSVALGFSPITKQKHKTQQNTEQLFSGHKNTQTQLKTHYKNKVHFTQHNFLPLIALSTLTSRQIRGIKQKRRMMTRE